MSDQHKRNRTYKIGTESFTAAQLATIRRYLEARMGEADIENTSAGITGNGFWNELNRLDSRAPQYR